jgi:hypothetical protein
MTTHEAAQLVEQMTNQLVTMNQQNTWLNRMLSDLDAGAVVDPCPPRLRVRLARCSNEGVVCAPIERRA